MYIPTKETVRELVRDINDADEEDLDYLIYGLLMISYPTESSQNN